MPDQILEPELEKPQEEVTIDTVFDYLPDGDLKRLLKELVLDYKLAIYRLPDYPHLTSDNFPTLELQEITDFLGQDFRTYLNTMLAEVTSEDEKWEAILRKRQEKINDVYGLAKNLNTLPQNGFLQEKIAVLSRLIHLLIEYLVLLMPVIKTVINNADKNDTLDAILKFYDTLGLEGKPARLLDIVALSNSGDLVYKSESKDKKEFIPIQEENGLKELLFVIHSINIARSAPEGIFNYLVNRSFSSIRAAIVVYILFKNRYSDLTNLDENSQKKLAEEIFQKMKVKREVSEILDVLKVLIKMGSIDLHKLLQICNILQVFIANERRMVTIAESPESDLPGAFKRVTFPISDNNWNIVEVFNSLIKHVITSNGNTIRYKADVIANAFRNRLWNNVEILSSMARAIQNELGTNDQQYSALLALLDENVQQEPNGDEPTIFMNLAASFDNIEKAIMNSRQLQLLSTLDFSQCQLRYDSTMEELIAAIAQLANQLEEHRVNP